MGHELQLEHRGLSEVECDEVEDGEGSETSMKGFVIKVCFNVRNGPTF